MILHSHAWAYTRGKVGLHDFVRTEAYSVCCQGDQLEKNYSSLTRENETNNNFVGRIKSAENFVKHMAQKNPPSHSLVVLNQG